MGSSESKSQHPEVLTPEPKPVDKQVRELETPWRKFNWNQKEELKAKLENFTPANPNAKDIKILVAGQIGAGKSSFINSICSAIQGRISARALVNSSAGDSHSFTQSLKGFTIRSGKKTLPFVFKDIMGLEPEVLAGSQTEDIINAVFGHVKDGYKFNQDQALSHKDQHYNFDPNLTDQAFCLVYIIPGDTVQFTDHRLLDKLKIIRQRISDKGIPQVVVMTKVDETCPLVRQDLEKMYTSKKIKQKMELCSSATGVPMSNIFPVKNYHDEIETDDKTDVLILKALEQIIQLADDRLEDSDIY
ncbi:interferon-induced protein 44-like isoform X2 [Puntigrus tetrazona]|uniref:interferon-induced protein 44-like isoform X2 n=1 Tax=Puntigrus tetrazona TaxID=1606681 RepID=UPI001C892085|nr:interferon-induced protein 44-like isoform X2 [Puntigrus tetrazona]